MKNYDPTTDKRRPEQHQAFSLLMQSIHKLNNAESDFIKNLKPKFDNCTRVTKHESYYLIFLKNKYLDD